MPLQNRILDNQTATVADYLRGCLNPNPPMDTD